MKNRAGRIPTRFLLGKEHQPSVVHTSGAKTGCGCAGRTYPQDGQVESRDCLPARANISTAQPQFGHLRSVGTGVRYFPMQPSKIDMKSPPSK